MRKLSAHTPPHPFTPAIPFSPSDRQRMVVCPARCGFSATSATVRRWWRSTKAGPFPSHAAGVAVGAQPSDGFCDVVTVLARAVDITKTRVVGHHLPAPPLPKGAKRLNGRRDAKRLRWLRSISNGARSLTGAWAWCAKMFVAWHVAKKGGRRWNRSRGCGAHMDGCGKAIALGLGLRHVWVSQYRARQFQAEIKWLGIRPNH